MLNDSIDSAICVTSDGAYIMWILGEDRKASFDKYISIYQLITSIMV